ncbi:hypothetical protein HV213_16675 [Klebsiella sp. RHBSTW-00484]|uniref:hypothetical protein n=1 Tax=unclassified Klebsiella TaxID=2608929 RepID=UPI0015E508F4|nr:MULTISPECIES: hypothetical protein [unclassified Klebsiella]QLO37333.1 hypothetical protein HV213_16675 [Klebsiella sp. RHBSTW-00484]QLT76851.1 hypothetical protein HV204_16675 [Klebsiella sp. RHBSTW-00464]
MSIVKTHTGTVITKDGPQQKLLHETPSVWVVGKTECYHKGTEKRRFAEQMRRQLLLDLIKPIAETNK